jgi:rare lipoprotein A
MKRLWLLVFFLPLLEGCGHKHSTAKFPPPPNLPQQAEAAKPSPTPQQQPNEAQPSTIPSAQVANEKPLLTETGIASWYGPPYHNRRGSNGELYDMNQMTAAHRTLPLNSVVRVTNIKTGHSAIVRITDRGPFIGERILDLSLAAAKAVDVWSPGIAWVKMEVLETPVPIDNGGKWAVQIGAFNTVSAAKQMKETLMNQYPLANVLEFGGPTGEWVRIRVPNDDRETAEQISRTITSPEGGVFLVRLD